MCNYGDTSDPTALDNDEVQSHYGPPVSHVLLDMDIFKNEPKILSSTTTLNAEKAKNSNLWWHGTEITITIAGSWSNYKSRILQYFQQLAVITPYADLNIYFRCIRDPKKDFSCDFQKRSEQMPPMAREILPHPNSLNHITLTRLIQESRYYQKSLSMFLMHELSGINNLTAEKIIRTLVETSLDVGSKASTGTGTLSKYDVIPSQLTSKNITALSQLLRDESSIKQPNHTNCIFAPDSSHPKGTRSGSCLSPVGEYNLRLGILKELKPRLIATYSDASTNYGTSSSSQHHYEGHPFVVEAAVALGSSNIVDMNSVDHSSNNSDALDNQNSSINQLNTNTKEQQYGIHIYRFANRIPLLFETGADVITQVATKVSVCYSVI